MKNRTKQLNDLIKNLSNNNANSSMSELAVIIDSCSKAGMRFFYDVNYEEALAVFTASEFPEWNMDVANYEIESLASQGKYEEATAKRDQTLLLKKEIQRQFRFQKYGTEDWFMEKPESEILFIPTHISVVDNLIFDMNN